MRPLSPSSVIMLHLITNSVCNLHDKAYHFSFSLRVSSTFEYFRPLAKFLIPSSVIPKQLEEVSTPIFLLQLPCEIKKDGMERYKVLEAFHKSSESDIFNI